MPYISIFFRDVFSQLVKDMDAIRIDDPGQLNYLLTQLVHTYLKQHQEGYQNYNDVLGALEGCKLELYRKFISKYEDHKIEINGDVP